ncbi:MAG: TraR/DksA C4-type zinc finger protein [Campylobacterales bacterium]|jgi:DnaK suppressor protein
MTQEETKEFETLLLSMKADIESNIARLMAEREAVSTEDEIDDMEDEASLQSESMHEEALLKQQQHELDEINHALDKIEKGTYGICEASGTPIPLERLRARPHARYGYEDQLKAEQ